MATIYENVEDLLERVGILETSMTSVQNQIADLGIKVLSEDADIHELAVGDYYIPNATVAATILNRPVTNNHTAFIKVIPGGDVGQKSVYYIPCNKTAPGYYHCAFYQEAWGAWNHVNLSDSGWIDLPLNDGITAYSEAQKPRYRRIGNEVFLAGVFKGVTANDTDIAILPAGFRPSKKVIFAMGSIGQKINRMEILVEGTVRYNRSTIEPSTAENWHSLACSFCVD